MSEWEAAHRYSLMLQNDGKTAFVWQWSGLDGKCRTSWVVASGLKHIASGVEATQEMACKYARALLGFERTPA